MFSQDEIDRAWGDRETLSTMGIVARFEMEINEIHEKLDKIINLWYCKYCKRWSRNDEWKIEEINNSHWISCPLCGKIRQ